MRTTVAIPPAFDDFEDVDVDVTPTGGPDKIIVDVAIDGTTGRRVTRSMVGRGTIVGHSIPSRPPAVVASHQDPIVRYLERVLGMTIEGSPAWSMLEASNRPSMALSLLMAWDPDDYPDPDQDEHHDAMVSP